MSNHYPLQDFSTVAIDNHDLPNQFSTFSSSPLLNNTGPTSNRFSNQEQNDTTNFSVPRKPVRVRESAHRSQGSVEDQYFQKPHGIATYQEIRCEEAPIKHSTRKRYCNPNSWTLEIVALLVSIASLVAALVVLLLQDGKPLASWTFVASLNTLVSILGTISKGALAYVVGSCIGQQKWNFFRSRQGELDTFEDFDDASRGPLGSLMLLIRLKGRHWAALGAFVTIITLAWDPFLQAIVSYDGSLDEIVSTTNAPLVGHQNYLDMGKILEDPAGGQILLNQYVILDIYTTSPDFAITSAIYSGLSNTSVKLDVLPKFTCDTGNCTWPIFTTAAICSTCQDVSNQIVPVPGYGDNNGTDRAMVSNAHMIGNWTNYKLSYSHIKSYFGFSNGKSGLTDRFKTFLTVNSTADYRNTISLQKQTTLLIAFLIMKGSPDYVANKTEWQFSTPVATECGLFLCANAYQNTVQNGKLAQTLKGSWADREPKSWRASDYPGHAGPNSSDPYTQAYMAWDQSNPSLSTYNLFRTDLQLSIPSDAASKLPTSITTKFNITQAFIASTQQFLLYWGLGAQTSYKTFMVYPFSPSSNSNFPVAEQFFQSTNLTLAFDNLAQSLTSRIQDSANVTLPGSQQQWVTHIRINKPFAILPIITTALGCLYFLLIIWDTVKSGLPVWKAALIPSLVSGFDNETQELLRNSDMHQGSTTSKTAWKTPIKLEDDGGQLRLQVI